MKRFEMKIGAVLPLALILSACGESDVAKGRSPDEAHPVEQSQVDSGAATGPALTPPLPQTPAEAPTLPPPNLRLEVNLAERELYVYREQERIATHPVAVGSEEWPTPTVNGLSAR